MKPDFRDLLLFAGIGLLLAGVAMLSRPAACILGGLMLAALAFILPRSSAKAKEKNKWA